MSMIRDLRAAVRPSRPSLRKDTGAYDTTRDPSTPSAVVDCAVYRDGRRVETDCQLSPHEAMRQVRRDGGFVWIGLHEPSEAEFSGIASEFGLHPLAVEDAVQAHQRPKLERYDDSLFTVFKTIHYVEHDELTANSEIVETGEVMCFTGRDFFITVRHGGQGSLRALRHRLQDDPELLAKGPSAVLHSIADHVVDGYVAVADAVQDDIDEVETEVFTPGRGGLSPPERAIRTTNDERNTSYADGSAASYTTPYTKEAQPWQREPPGSSSRISRASPSSIPTATRWAAYAIWSSCCASGAGRPGCSAWSSNCPRGAASSCP